MEQNWLPREVAGWPTPYLSDNPNTAVIHDLGVNDNFRAGSFIATLSFWFIIVSVWRRFVLWVRRKMHH